MAPSRSKKRKQTQNGERTAERKVRRISDSGNQATAAKLNDSVVAQGTGDSNAEEKPRPSATQDRQSSSSMQIQVFPTALPTQLPVYEEEGTYAVRPCYIEYYDLITAQLRHGTRTITVSGTSGTGNTMFYGYVFSRFSRENPDAIIITASSTDESRLLRVTVFEGERVIEAKNDDGSRIMKKARALAIERKAKLVYMLDGPPKSPPPPPAQMICFTNPSNEWVDKLEHAAHSFVCYTSLWELDELVATAAHVPWRRPGKPDVFLDRATVEERFATFGGVARECLAGYENFVTRRKNELVHDIVTMRIRALDALRGGGDFRPTSQRVWHYVPDSRAPWRRSIRTASNFVSNLLREHIDQTLSFLPAKFRQEVLAGLSALSEEDSYQRERKIGGGRAVDAKKGKLKRSSVQAKPQLQTGYQPGVFFKLAVWEEYKETFMSDVRDAEENSTEV